MNFGRGVKKDNERFIGFSSSSCISAHAAENILQMIDISSISSVDVILSREEPIKPFSDDHLFVKSISCAALMHASKTEKANAFKFSHAFVALLRTIIT